MKSSHRPFVAVFVIFAAVMAVVGVSRWMTPPEIVPWRHHFSKAQAESKSTGKPILVYFTADWCAPCHTLKRTTWADKKVEAALRAYVPVRVDVNLDTPVALRYGAEFLPRYAVLDEEGKVVRAVDGYLNAEQFLAWLKG